MSLRRRNLDRIDGGHFDVLVVGGGINGAVSAAVLAGRGASVAVVDRGDFGAFTSQESSNLVWGGFKYLETYELALVRKLCMSRNRLLSAYPDNIKSIGFMASLERDGKYAPWFAYMGALGYWAIGNFRTPRPRVYRPEKIERLEPLVDTTELAGGIEYYDAYLADNDSRFVFSFVRSAMDVGAAAANYVELVDARFDGARWQAKFHDLDAVDADGRPAVLGCTANMIVNAAGPFVDDLNSQWDVKTKHRIVYSKGIHLIVPRLTNDNRVLAFFDDTDR
ncbi:MAG: FAD-dependent oxidoreductase, partial [Acidimicrobiales bacterium]|nr:FAD-dependent oxidoreductase [Acidimicrobiales bacterium]